MRTLVTLQVADLIRRYDSLGADIRRLVGDTKEVSLVEDETGLRMWRPLILGDGEFYRQLSDHNPWYYATEKREYDVAARFLGGDDLLEVGCGEGHFAAWVKGARYTGLELSEHAVASAQRRRLQVMRQDFAAFAEKHPGCFDRVCSFQVLEHLPAPDAYFKAAHRALRDGGLLITAVPADDSYLGSLHDDCLNAPPHHVSRWTDDCLKRYPESFGFRLHDLVHLPVEQGHAQRLIHAFVSRTLLRPSPRPPGLLERLQRRAVVSLLRSLPADTPIPAEFFIPGHTVLAVHRRVRAEDQ